MTIDEQMARIRYPFSPQRSGLPLENLQDLQMAVECFPNLVKHHSWSGHSSVSLW